MNRSHFQLQQLDIPTGALRIRHDEEGECGRVMLLGEFDLAGVDDFYNVVDRVFRSTPQSLVIDVARLRFCDSSGVGALAATARRCRAERIDMRVVGVGPALASTFEVMQAGELFPIEQ